MEPAVLISARVRWARMLTGGGLLSLGMAGCKVGPNDVKQDLALIGSFTESLGTDAIAEASRLRSWWTHFRDPTLDRLIGHAITSNLDVQILRQRLEQARAHKQIAGARLMPQVGAVGMAQEGYASRTLIKPRGYGSFRIYMAGFDATWELDVFGGIRRREEAAEDEVQAMIEHRRAAMVSVISELASDYATLRATQHRIAIAERNLNTARRVTHLTQRKYAQGVIGNLAVA